MSECMKKAEQKLRGCLSYCRAVNSLPYCKNCGLSKDIIDEALETERQKRDEMVREAFKEAGNYVDELYQSGNMGENEYALLTDFFDEKLTQTNNPKEVQFSGDGKYCKVEETIYKNGKVLPNNTK